MLKNLGISNWKNLYHNLSYDELFKHETNPSLKGYERGFLTKTGSVTVDTGKFTGRSPKDKYLIKGKNTEKNVWWFTKDNKSDNRPITKEIWEHLKRLAIEELNGKNLYVNDCFCGANENSRMSIRVVTQIAWMSHFVKNMFIRPTDDELKNFKPDWTILHAPKTTNQDFKKQKLNSENFVAFDIEERMTVIGGTWYGGEVKKGIFSMMNYFLPLKGIGAFHCSANEGEKGDTAMFFGLSGTGKTTLSTDIKRKLIGDDEHGWDGKGVFNFEGGCYAKTIKLSREKEPEIYDAIKRDALLENVVIDKAGNIDFDSSKKTENTRVSYPIYHIHNIVEPISRGTHPSNIIFLTADAFGILPPVAKLSEEQAMYQFLSGYTAKVAGTEIGVTEPKAAFSPCFGAPFLTLHPTKYAEILGKKMVKHKSHAYLVNTGWSGGAYGTGDRMPLNITRAIIDAIHDGSIRDTEFEIFPCFNFQIPKSLPNVPSEILNPKNTWKDKAAYDKGFKKLVNMFIENFKSFTDTEEGKALENCVSKD